MEHYDVCERCSRIKRDVLTVKFQDGETPDLYKMCRKCRNIYQNDITIPLYLNGTIQFKKYEEIARNFFVDTRTTQNLNRKYGETLQIVLPPELTHYGIPIDFDISLF